jgi:hypothetical protein
MQMQMNELVIMEIIRLRLKQGEIARAHEYPRRAQPLPNRSRWIANWMPRLNILNRRFYRQPYRRARLQSEAR